MIDDILTVVWKERKGLLRTQGGRAKTIFTALVPTLFIGILLPLQVGTEWVEDAWSLVAAVIIPLILVGIAVPQSFAGERERHTLETLLASRLPDLAVLLGKVFTAVAYGWGVTLLVLLLSLIPMNLAHWTGRILVYDPSIALADVVVSLLFSGLIASVGVLISLRSVTAQGAQQALISVLLIPLMVFQIVPMIMLSIVPNGREILQGWLSVDFTQVVLVLVAFLVMANIGFLLAAINRFQRSRLFLD